MGNALFYRALAPAHIDGAVFFLTAILIALSDNHQAFGGILTTLALIAIEHHILNRLARLDRDVVIDFKHRRVDDTHGQAVFDRMIKKY